MITQKIYLTFPKKQVTEPVICNMYDKLRVRFNIRSASVNDHVGIMAVELEADTRDKINQAIAFFREAGLTVDPIEMDVISG